jgi:carnitine O-acetyltransferase
MAEITKTFNNQDRLPRLPVPDLQSTCRKFLEWVKPLTDEKEYAETVKITDDFLLPGGTGEKLQEQLIEWSKSGHPNWLEPFWDEMYLKYRGPIPVNLNFGFIFENFTPLSMTRRASFIIRETLKFKIILDRGEIPPDTTKGNPLCMMQFRRLFSSTRLPLHNRDILRTPVSDNPATDNADHIIILFRGSIYRLQLITEKGLIPSKQELEKTLDELVLSSEDSFQDNEGTGIFTTLEREEWASIRLQMLESPVNKNTLESIENALFALCLDETTPSSLEELSSIILHSNGKNRWFDKSIQFIVCGNGECGINIEHSGLDGTSISKLAEFIFNNEIADHELTDPAFKPAPEKIVFDTDDKLKQASAAASAEFKRFTDNTLTRIIEYNNFGKDLIRSFNLQPDPFVQLAIQLAQYKLYGKCYSTYEAVMTRGFLHGRTEAMRSVTSESNKFVEIICDPMSSQELKKVSLLDAVKKHNSRIKDCQAGLGIERHLIGLQKISGIVNGTSDNSTPHPLFLSPGWNALRHDRISTSNGSFNSGRFFLFGPVVDDGFGIGYIINNNKLTFNITGRSSVKADLNRFTAYLEESLNEMSMIFERE